MILKLVANPLQNHQVNSNRVFYHTVSTVIFTVFKQGPKLWTEGPPRWSSIYCWNSNTDCSFFCSTICWNMQEIKLPECVTLPLQENLQNLSLCCQVTATWYIIFYFLGLEYVRIFTLVFPGQLLGCDSVSAYYESRSSREVCQYSDNRYRLASSLVERLTPYQEDICSTT